MNPSTIEGLQEGPQNSKLCLIQTKSKQYIQCQKSTITISQTEEITPENYFYLTIQPNLSELRICSAQSGHYLTIGQDNILTVTEDIESSTNFELFTKVNKKNTKKRRKKSH